MQAWLCQLFNGTFTLDPHDCSNAHHIHRCVPDPLLQVDEKSTPANVKQYTIAYNESMLHANTSKIAEFQVRNDKYNAVLIDGCTSADYFGSLFVQLIDAQAKDMRFLGI
jgi:hypothetical protein